MRYFNGPNGTYGLRGVLSVILLLGALFAASGLMAPNSAGAQAPDGEDKPAATANGEEDAEVAKKKSLLVWVAESLGWGYSIIFLALSFALVALFVMNLLQANRANVVPNELVEGFEEHLNAKQYSEAYELANADESFLGKVLSSGISKLSGGGGYPQAIEAMQEVGEEENMKLEHRLSYMALIGTISPMIGLLGTVHGMIGAFDTIARTATGAPEATELAGKISTALFTTLAGLMIAIPAIAAYNILRNRIARLVLEVGIVSEGLMSRFQNHGEKK